MSVSSCGFVWIASFYLRFFAACCPCPRPLIADNSSTVIIGPLGSSCILGPRASAPASLLLSEVSFLASGRRIIASLGLPSRLARPLSCA
ncbi:hypothetical protein F4860DRAFT_479640 [Xylaria cubensis]|nr:hypothetical protein F4860DRAFT_479640 [Xylaria cubensis]